MAFDLRHTTSYEFCTVPPVLHTTISIIWFTIPQMFFHFHILTFHFMDLYPVSFHVSLVWLSSACKQPFRSELLVICHVILHAHYVKAALVTMQFQVSITSHIFKPDISYGSESSFSFRWLQFILENLSLTFQERYQRQSFAECDLHRSINSTMLIGKAINVLIIKYEIIWLKFRLRTVYGKMPFHVPGTLFSF